MPAGMKVNVDQKQLERVCRMYNVDKDAAGALGISESSFRKWCGIMKVETPYKRGKGKRNVT